MSKLFFASVAVLVALCGLVFAVGFLVILKMQLPPAEALPICAGFAILIVSLQYWLGPLVIDAVVQIRWTSAAELGPDFDKWLQTTCNTFKIPLPRFGIIEEGSPNAFTYGNGPWNARVVVTRGVIDALDPEELKAVVAHELGHIKNRDFIVMTVVQALVLALYTLYMASRFSRNRNTTYVVIAAWVAYQLSYYISLFLSRVREYMADFASAQIMSSGNPLSTALVKISYGMGRLQPATPSGGGQRVPAPRGPLGSPGAAPAASYMTAPPQRAASQQIILPPVGGQTYAAAPPVSMPPIDPNAAAVHAALNSSSVSPGLMAKLNQIQSDSDKKHGGAPQMQQAIQANKRQISTQALGAFGIASAAGMRSAVTWCGNNGTVDPSHFAAGARWELFNPWAKIAELISTHPLTARRIQALQKLNARWNEKPAYDFSKIKPGKYSGFSGDVVISFLPITLGLVTGFGIGSMGVQHVGSAVCYGVSAFCGGLIIQLMSKYRGGFKRAKVLGCLGELNVSHMRPIPVVLQGMFTGRLSAGLAWADDFVLQDDTGFVACILNQPLKFMEWIWGWMYSSQFVGQDVVVYGWYRRFGSPFVEISHFEVPAMRKTVKAYYYPAALAFSVAFCVGFACLAMIISR